MYIYDQRFFYKQTITHTHSVASPSQFWRRRSSQFFLPLVRLTTRSCGSRRSTDSRSPPEISLARALHCSPQLTRARRSNAALFIFLLCTCIFVLLFSRNYSPLSHYFWSGQFMVGVITFFSMFSGKIYFLLHPGASWLHVRSCAVHV